MFRKIFAILAITLSSVAYAGQTSIDTSGLTEAQIAELKAHAAKVVADTARGVEMPAQPEKVGAMVTLAATWGQQAAAAAEGFARALSIAAKELGVTVNDFLHTDAGKLTAVLIIWKVAGASITSLIYGSMFAIVGMCLARVIYKRLFTKEYKEVQYEYFFGMFKGTRMMRIPKSFHELNEDGEWLMVWVMILLVIVPMIIGGIIIT